MSFNICGELKAKISWFMYTIDSMCTPSFPPPLPNPRTYTVNDCFSLQWENHIAHSFSYSLTWLRAANAYEVKVKRLGDNHVWFKSQNIWSVEELEAYFRAQSRRNHTTDRLEKRGVERREVLKEETLADLGVFYKIWSVLRKCLCEVFWKSCVKFLCGTFYNVFNE